MCYIVAATAALMLTVTSASGAAESRRFDAQHELEVRVPAGARQVRIWFAVPQRVPHQRIDDFSVEAPFSHRIVEDSEGNRFLFAEIAAPSEDLLRVKQRFVLTRSEANGNVDPKATRPYTAEDVRDKAAYLEPDTYVVINERVRELASQIAQDEPNPIVAARRIYDWMLDHVDYWVKQPGLLKASKVGSTTYCLDTGTGNCTDFHSLYASLSRANGIPTRIVYGSLFKPELDGTDTDQSYHCWIEFWAPGVEWVPLDVAIADIFAGEFPIDDANRTLVSRTTATGYSGPDPKLVEYYFGNLDARRVTWSIGRDLVLEPRPAAGAINALPKAYIEVDGESLLEGEGWTRSFTFREIIGE